jgi:hypothetical protein
VKYTERVVRWANDRWTDPMQQNLVPPVRRWVLPSPPRLQFGGINPGGATPIAGAIGGINEEHIRLAERLRRRRACLLDVHASEGAG